MQENPILQQLAARALESVGDGAIVGLGSGRAALAFVRALGEKVRGGLRIKGIPTSEETGRVALEYGIELIGLEDCDSIDVTIDGADEVDPNLDLIKGYGGALVREKIVAAASQREIILVGDEKLVPKLGARGILPVEVIQFAVAVCRKRLTALGCRPQVRQRDGKPFVSDGGNYILDCGVEPLPDPRRLDAAIREIPGVVGTGLFLGVADLVLVGTKTEVREMVRPRP